MAENSRKNEFFERESIAIIAIIGEKSKKAFPVIQKTLKCFSVCT